MKRVGILAAMFAASSAFAADGTTHGGYVDAQYNWQKKNTNTFQVKEGSVWLKGMSGNSTGVVEIPFSYTAPVTTGTTTTNTSALTLGMDRAQAYVEMKYDSGFSWKLGQFHSMYGSEGKRTLGLPFADYSMITRNFMPWTHTGVSGSYWITGDMYATLMIANQFNTGTMTKGNPDLGVKLGGKFANVGIEELSVAFLMGRNGSTKPWMVSGILDMSFGPLHLRGDGLLRKNFGRDTEIGIGGYAAYELSDMMSFGLRGAFATNQAGAKEKFEMSVGPEFEMSKALTTKVNYTLGKPAGKGLDTIHKVAVAGVYAF